MSPTRPPARPNLFLEPPISPPARFRSPVQREDAPLRLSLDRGASPQRLAQDLLQNLARDATTPQLVGPGRPAELYVGYDPPTSFRSWALTATHFVPVVSFWLPITEVTYADLARVFHGEAGNWEELGCPKPVDIVPLSLQTDPPAPLQPAAGRPLPDVDALVAALDQFPGGVALVPLEQVDVRLRALRVDGYDPLLEGSWPAEHPLSRRLFLAFSPTVPESIGQRVSLFAQKRRLLPPEPGIDVAVVGDVMPGRYVRRSIAARGGDCSCPFAYVSPLLRRADLTIANLEGALSDRIVPPSDAQTMLFLGDSCFGRALREAGVDGVSLANNHSRNFGAAGISHTLALLDEIGLVPFGAGMDLEQARRPALFEVKGTTFAFLGYDAISYELYGAGEERAGTAPATPDSFSADIAAAREVADVVVLYFHWGWEYTHNPSPWQRQLAYQASESGADVILGSHPHWLQGLERYQETVILHSLGNFVFDQKLSLEAQQGVIAHLIFRHNHLVNLRLQAVQIVDYFQPVPLPAQEAEQVYDQIRQANPTWPHEKGAHP